MPVSGRHAPLTGPSSCNAAAETALHFLSWCSENMSSRRHSHPAEHFVHRRCYHRRLGPASLLLPLPLLFLSLSLSLALSCAHIVSRDPVSNGPSNSSHQNEYHILTEVYHFYLLRPSLMDLGWGMKTTLQGHDAAEYVASHATYQVWYGFTLQHSTTAECGAE